MPPTVVGPVTARWLVGAFLAIILVVPLWDAVGPVESPSYEALAAAASAAGGGGLVADLAARMERFEENLEDTSDAGARLRSALGPLVSRVGGARGDVLIGRRDWLFLKPGVDSLLLPASAQEKTAGGPVQAIAGFARQLAERGVHLILLPAPTKAAVHPRLLAPRFGGVEAPLNVARWERLRVELEAVGVEVYDPAPEILAGVLEENKAAYLIDDTHWRPEVVDAVARRLAQRITPRLTGAPAGEWIRSPVEVTGVGDLRRTLEPEAAPWHSISLQVVRGPDEAEGAPVLLLGDSFTNVFSDDRLGWGRGAGLAEQLAFHLQRPVERLAIDGGGATEVRQRLAARLAAGTMSLDGVQVVVWQVAARELVLADWRPVALPSMD